MKKTIPNRNYIILAAIIIITIISVFYAKTWYNTAKNYNEQTPIVTSVINEINPNEISNYALESPKFILYTSKSQEPEVQIFEKRLKRYIINKNLSENIIYINIDNYTNDEITNILKQYTGENLKNKITISNQSNMFVFENQKIIANIKNVNKKSIKEINDILKFYGVVE